MIIENAIKLHDLKIENKDLIQSLKSTNQKLEEINKNLELKVKERTKVIEHNDNLFIQKAEWFRAGCFLALNETEQARRQLAMIASSANHFYKSEAEKILKRMKR